MTPECSNSAWTLLSSTGATVDASVVGVVAQRPLFTATIGFVRASRRAKRVNLRGLPNDSMYSSTTSVAGSVCQYCSTSLPDRSARLPAETKVDRPSPRPAAAASRVTLERAGLAEEAHPAGRGQGRGQRGVEPDLRIGVRDPERVRAHHPHPVRAGLLHEPALGAHPARARRRRTRR